MLSGSKHDLYKNVYYRTDSVETKATSCLSSSISSTISDSFSNIHNELLQSIKTFEEHVLHGKPESRKGNHVGAILSGLLNVTNCQLECRIDVVLTTKENREVSAGGALTISIVRLFTIGKRSLPLETREGAKAAPQKGKSIDNLYDAHVSAVLSMCLQ